MKKLFFVSAFFSTLPFMDSFLMLLGPAVMISWFFVPGVTFGIVYGYCYFKYISSTKKIHMLRYKLFIVASTGSYFIASLLYYEFLMRHLNDFIGLFVAGFIGSILLLLSFKIINPNLYLKKVLLVPLVGGVLALPFVINFSIGYKINFSLLHFLERTISNEIVINTVINTVSLLLLFGAFSLWQISIGYLLMSSKTKTINGTIKRTK